MKGPPPKPSTPDRDETYVQAQYSKDLEWVHTLVEASQRQNFYGRLTLTFNNGMLVHVDTNRTLKPPHRNQG